MHHKIRILNRNLTFKICKLRSCFCNSNKTWLIIYTILISTEHYAKIYFDIFSWMKLEWIFVFFLPWHITNEYCTEITLTTPDMRLRWCFHTYKSITTYKCDLLSNISLMPMIFGCFTLKMQTLKILTEFFTPLWL